MGAIRCKCTVKISGNEVVLTMKLLSTVFRQNTCALHREKVFSGLLFVQYSSAQSNRKKAKV
jgi:hypothetical protein